MQVCCGKANFAGGGQWTGYTLDCAASASACTGELRLSCDGAEDCAAGQSCCLTNLGPSYKIKSACQASCGTVQPPFPIQLCHDHSECNSGQPYCCTYQGPDVPDGTKFAFGFCLDVATVSMSTGLDCDTP